MSDRFDILQLQDPREFAQAMHTTEQVVYDQEKAGQLISVLPPNGESGRLFPGFQQSSQLNEALHRKAIALYRSRGLDMTVYWDFLRTRHAAFGGATGVEVLLDLTANSALRELVDDHPILTRRDHSNLTHPQGYLTAAGSVDKSLSGLSV